MGFNSFWDSSKKALGLSSANLWFFLLLKKEAFCLFRHSTILVIGKVPGRSVNKIAWLVLQAHREGSRLGLVMVTLQAAANPRRPGSWGLNFPAKLPRIVCLRIRCVHLGPGIKADAVPARVGQLVFDTA